MACLSHLWSIVKYAVFRVCVLLRTAVVGRLARDGHIVRVTFHYAGTCDAHKLGIVELVYSGCSAVAHTGLQAACELIDDLVERTLVGYAACDALGNELLGIFGAGLEVAVLGAILHSLERAHTFTTSPE